MSWWLRWTTYGWPGNGRPRTADRRYSRVGTGLQLVLRNGAWLHEGEDAFRQAAEAIGGVGLSVEQTAVFAHLLAHQGWFCSRQGRYGQAQTLLQRSLALLRPLDDQLALADALTCLGTLHPPHG